MPSEPRTPSRAAASAVAIRALVPSDEAAALAACARAFELPSDSPLASAEGWRRRYFGNPSGTRASVAIDAEGRILAQYAGLPRRATLDGACTTLTQGVDSLADPTLGRGLGSLFVRVGEHFASEYGGRLGDGDPFMWGYPVREAWRVGRERLGYVTMRSQLALVASARREPGRAGSVRVREADRFPAELDGWFEGFRSRYDAICDRTRETLAWRYADRGFARRYRVGLALSGASIVGLAVGRTLELEGAQRFALCEWLVPPEARGALLDWAAGAAHDGGTDELYLWLPPWHADFLALQAEGFRVRPTARVLVGRSYDRRYPPEWFAERWFTTLGDTDLS